jgi:hypothetical protein
MQQVLELLEATSGKFITEQLNSKQPEEVFAVDHQNCYGQDVFIDSTTVYAHISHSNTRLIGDDLSQQEINFRAPFLDA